MTHYAPPRDPLASISGIVDTLSKGEQRVARCILKDPGSAGSGSLRHLAENSGSSVSTVIRFCKRLGYSGFVELRAGLTTALASDRIGYASHPLFDALSPDDSIETLSEKLIALHLTALQQTVRLVDREALDKVVDLIRSARHRLIFATAASSTPAEDLALKLNMLGLPTMVFDDIHKAILTMGAFGGRDVVIGLTYTGRIRDVGVVLGEARKLSIPTVGVTHELNSRVARSADYVLRPMGSEFSQLTAGLSTRTAQLAIGDLIFLSIAHASPQTSGFAAEGIFSRAVDTFLGVDPRQ